MKQRHKTCPKYDQLNLAKSGNLMRKYSINIMMIKLFDNQFSNDLVPLNIIKHKIIPC